MNQSITFTELPFGTNLRLLREQMGLTQNELASRVGYSTSQINRLELGKRRPNITMVRDRFMQALNLTAHDQAAHNLLLSALSAKI